MKYPKRTSEGRRSGLEDTVASQLTAALGKGNFKYEREIGTLEYADPRVRKYLPDFQLPNGIIVECKGWYKTEDRRKHLLIKQQSPDLDIRFVFSNSNSKISKKSQTTYAMWCERNGFKWADKLVPVAWLNEPCSRPKGIEYFEEEHEK